MGKTNQSDFFQKKHAFLQATMNFEQMNKNANITGMIHHKMMVFTIHMLRAQERLNTAGSG